MSRIGRDTTAGIEARVSVIPQDSPEVFRSSLIRWRFFSSQADIADSQHPKIVDVNLLAIPG